MDPAFLFIQALNGLAAASQLFLIACGLTIVFGVTRIVNFAHGSFYMIGAYLAVTLTGPLMDTLGPVPGFWVAVVMATIAAGLLGTVMEVLLLRRIYRAPELFQLLATFGVVLVVQDLVLLIWGPEDRLGPRAPGLEGAVTILGQRFPQHDLLMIALGPLVLIGLSLLFHRTRWGVLVRAATEDREMVAALGVNQALLFTGAVFLGTALAGLAGALDTPRQPASPAMDVSVIVQAFVITVIGGLGSVPGAFLAALLIGQLQAFGILVLPKITLVLSFLVMAVVLTIRPAGLLGRREPARAGAFAGGRTLRPWAAGARTAAVAVAGGLLAAPWLAGPYTLDLLTEVVIFALFALSLNLLMGIGGMISFGHAAYFGLGAYAAALLVEHADAGMVSGLLAAPALAATAGLVFGWFCVRLSGVYLAMLTLAFAQILWSTAVQWTTITGGDNGLFGIWPAAWADGTVFYYLTLTLAGGGIMLLRTASLAPWGFALRAGRDHADHAEAIGLPVRGLRWSAFGLAGAAAGLAGGLYAFSKGSIDPAVLGIPTSVDALAMVLLGGVQTVSGPIVGAAALSLLEAWLLPLTDHWRLVLGSLIIGLVLAFPQGIVGALADARARARAP